MLFGYVVETKSFVKPHPQNTEPHPPPMKKRKKDSDDCKETGSTQISVRFRKKAYKESGTNKAKVKGQQNHSYLEFVLKKENMVSKGS